MAAHIPAWRRLGLQLKSQGDASNSADVATVTSKKRKLSLETANGNGKENAGARRRTSEWASSKLLPKAINLAKNSEAKPDTIGNVPLASPEVIESTKQPKKRKSVSFSANVKDMDGPAEAEDRSEVIGIDGPADQMPSAAESKMRKERKPRTSKAKTASETNDDTNDLATHMDRPYLHYLQQHHTDKAGWKFNKNQQMRLLSNTFNLYRIPASYDAAFINYVSGLQGTAVRLRLKQEAQAIVFRSELKSNDDGLDGIETDTGTEATAEAASKENDDSSHVAAAQLSRAGAILEVLAKEPSPPKTISSTKTNTSTNTTLHGKLKAPARSRGRKRRMEADIDSSSSSSTSSSSSSEETNDESGSEESFSLSSDED